MPKIRKKIKINRIRALSSLSIEQKTMRMIDVMNDIMII